MRERLALQIVAKLSQECRPAETKDKEVKELFYCKGKGGVCDEPCKNESCRHYDGTGAVAVPTVADRIRGMSDKKLAECIMDLYLRMSDPEFDISELWCTEAAGCTVEERMLYCDYEKQLACIERYLRQYVGAVDGT